MRFLIFMIETILLNSVKLRLQIMIRENVSLVIRLGGQILICIIILIYIVEINAL